MPRCKNLLCGVYLVRGKSFKICILFALYIKRYRTILTERNKFSIEFGLHKRHIRPFAIFSKFLVFVIRGRDVVGVGLIRLLSARV